jgi:hypothetical protein
MIHTECFSDNDMLFVSLLSASKGCFPLFILLTAMFTSLSGLMIRRTESANTTNLKEQINHTLVPYKVLTNVVVQ